MTKKLQKETTQSYARRPPQGWLLAHNHIMHLPTTPNGVYGFRRFWIPPQWATGDWCVCPCGWRPKFGAHYAHAEHVQWWATLLAQHGSLPAAHQHVLQLINAEGAWATAHLTQTQQ